VSRRAKMNMAPMAVASDGALVVNTAQLTTSNSLPAIIKAAESTGLDVFIGVVVPERLRSRVLRDLNDAAADIVGRLGPTLTAPVVEASASDHAAVVEHRGRQGRHGGRPQHRRGPRA